MVALQGKALALARAARAVHAKRDARSLRIGGMALIQLHAPSMAQKAMIRPSFVRSIVTTAETTESADASAHIHGHVQARLDYKKLAANLEDAIANVKKRFSDANPALVAELYEQQAKKKHEINLLRAERNTNAKQLGQAKAKGVSDEEFEALRARGQALKTEIAENEEALEALLVQLEAEAMKMPNDTHPDVPVGEEADSAIVAMHGKKPGFDFEPKDHYDLAMDLELLDTHTAAKVSSSKFVYLCNEAAMLELALVHWTLSKLRARGFTVWFPPDVAHYKMVEGCGFHPRGEATQIYSIANSDLCLTATSEITLAAMKSNEIIPSTSLPLKYAGFSHCFRTEVGHGGRQTRGIYRIHQFSKVEMFGFCADMEQSLKFFDEMVAIQTEMYTELGIHFQIVDMATADLGNPAYRKFDILAWMPGRGEYGEISSMSMCTDYQARRLNIRHKHRKEDPTQFVHTLNGTACAVPRLLISLLETYQQKDGSVVIPEVLRPYMVSYREAIPLIDELLPSIQIGLDDPAFIIDWRPTNVAAFVFVANQMDPAQAPPWLRTRPGGMTPESFMDDVVNKVQPDVDRRRGWVFLAPNTMEQYDAILGRFIAIQNAPFLQDVAQAALPVINNVEPYLAVTYFLTESRAHRAQPVNLQPNCFNDAPMRQLFI
ncbi:hypothetical protein Poli38472_001829 [Pythium oligandrum]|uniref:serine--tRNA ligase n=1 Tax=Pythium oligandrum TaxID=41045 RepID=A0A8K1FTK3_PYTOL|nr:hypothetical protein Poli38472_001829 [Pythium oligandrum]|eukprot:TMW69673.1 hypothetical protein Poli38472_001829 [Pythium oligandrum]